MIRPLIALLCASLVGATAAEATRVPVDPQDIRTAVERRWEREAPVGCTLEVKGVPNLTADVTADTEVDVVLPDDMTRPGPRAVPVSIRANGRIQSRGLANVVIRSERMVWVARRDLAAGEELAPADLLAENRLFDRQPVRLFDFDPAETWRVTRAVSAGQPVRADHVETVPDVEAGEEIWLLSRTGSATVSVAGRARQSGDVGATILVHNPVTGALVRAVILDPQSAELVTLATPRGGTAR